MNILTKMYQGSYVLKDDRVGHEFINLIKADGEEKGHYIWLNSNGNFNYGGKNHTVLMVRTLSGGLYQILGKATGCAPLKGCDSQKERNAKKRYKMQKDLRISYGKTELAKIHKNELNTFVTFEAEKVFQAKNKMFVTNDKALVNNKNVFYLEIKCKTSMREYFDKTKKRVKQYTDIINNDDIWKPKEVSGKLNNFIDNYLSKKKEEDNMFSILSKEEDENCISNSIRYFLNKYNYKKNFLKEIGVKHLKNKNVELHRELNDIDLFFKCNNKIVVIENKINAGITIKKNDTFKNQIEAALKNQDIIQEIEDAGLNKKYIKKVIRKRFRLFSKRKAATQLSKYVIIAHIYACCYNIKKNNVLFYLLVPNYSKALFTSKNKKSKILFANKYKVIDYACVHKIFKSLAKHKNDKYLNDFVNTLCKLKEDHNYDYEISLATNLKEIISQ